MDCGMAASIYFFAAGFVIAAIGAWKIGRSSQRAELNISGWSRQMSMDRKTIIAMSDLIAELEKQIDDNKLQGGDGDG